MVASQNFRWLHGEERAACPVCGDLSTKARLLDVASIPRGGRRQVFLRCSACATAFVHGQVASPPPATDDAIDLYVEHLARFDAMLEPLLRVPAGAVRRFLDVGCGFGFTLDFARWAFGWEVAGVDPSRHAAAGGLELGVPIEGRELA